MRITYIHQYFKTPSQAGGSRSFEFASRLARDGHEVTVICGGSDARKYEIEGFTVVQLRAPYNNKYSIQRRVAAMASFMVRSVVAAAKVPADVVFATSTPLSVAVPGIIAARARNARFIFEVRDLWPEIPRALGYLNNGVLYRAARALEWFTYRSADEVVALS
ncbi:MAG: glycosyltransferase, partial [Propionibacteriaceae bacterium]|nr:glycosyltransferase [Propionibacteriaceae bacterium]